MKAIQITQTGGPEVMSIREVPTPVPGPGEVLIRVAASGVNFIVFALVSTGQLKLRIERSYSLADAEQAHRDLNGRKTTGKLLLLP
jgi:NADPH:quinone reductase-like Zn-dependent oxidoreductase